MQSVAYPIMFHMGNAHALWSTNAIAVQNATHSLVILLREGLPFSGRVLDAEQRTPIALAQVRAFDRVEWDSLIIEAERWRLSEDAQGK